LRNNEFFVMVRFKTWSHMRILLAGASGFIGSHLRLHLVGVGHEVTVLQRKESLPVDKSAIFWDPSHGILDVNQVEGFDAFINLAGEPIVTGRWSEEKKKRIIESRVKATTTLSHTMKLLQKPPKIFISASAIGIYGSQGDATLTEESPSGAGFLADVCRKWEEAANFAKEAGSAVIIPRIGMVLSPDGGALAKMLPIFNLGLGGKIGDGKQWMSWIALPDLLRLFSFFLAQPGLDGAFNCVSPNPVTNKIFTKTLASVLSRPAFLPVPKWALKLLLGEFAEEVALSSIKAVAKKALASGFHFQQPELQPALETLLKK
jgi:uncharacterized protein